MDTAQGSFFAADVQPPSIDDLAGLLCGQGQAVGAERGAEARISIVVTQSWRAHELAAAFDARGLTSELTTSKEGHPLVRTPFSAELAALATGWTRGAVKSVPPGFTPDGPVLRMWALAAGRWVDSGYLLGTDPHAPDTHQPLAGALGKIGLTASVLGIRGGGPGLRLSGQRRLGRLAELVGPSPLGSAGQGWPAA